MNRVARSPKTLVKAACHERDYYAPALDARSFTSCLRNTSPGPSRAPASSRHDTNNIFAQISWIMDVQTRKSNTFFFVHDCEPIRSRTDRRWQVKFTVVVPSLLECRSCLSQVVWITAVYNDRAACSCRLCRASQEKKKGRLPILLIQTWTKTRFQGSRIRTGGRSRISRRGLDSTPRSIYS